MGVNSLNEESIFKIAVEIDSPIARTEYLRQICGDDEALLDRVMILLRADAESGSFMDSPPSELAGTVLGQTLTEKPGDSIGPYKLREQIGEGGFGVVFVAEQTKPVRRKVALKVIKPGMDSTEVVARFEAERQALALMDHPNIARVVDAGTTEAGRPFFAMELVNGVPITEFCNEQRLSTQERLRLFADVCMAVQHAHQKGIIHRDIKPSNVMVTMHDHCPVPKVIDFGIAKAIGGSLTEKTIYTAYGQLVGTPMYMSPEQAQLSGLDVDTRTDVYALGVLAYELLTGSPPFDKQCLEKAGFDEMRRIIREEVPRRPSYHVSTLHADKLATVSEQRNVDPNRLMQSLQGELDWIVMKTLEKDRTLRYGTAVSLADDVNRYLRGEAVQACPPTAAYRIRKFVRRNKTGISISLAMITLLLTGMAATSWQAFRATAEKNRAVNAEQLAELRLSEAQAARLETQREKNRAIEAERIAELRLVESENARQEAQATLSFLYDLIDQPRPTSEGGEERLSLVDIQDEIGRRKVLRLDTAMLEEIYDFARTSESFESIELAVKERLSKEIQSLGEKQEMNRRSIFQMGYLADRVGMKAKLLDTIRPLFADTLEEMLTAVLTESDLDHDDWNGVRELTESFPGLVQEDLKERIRPLFIQAVEKVVEVQKHEAVSDSSHRLEAIRVFELGKYLEMKELLPLALELATTKPVLSPRMRREAVHRIGMYGSMDHIEILAQLLGDRTPIYRFGQLSMEGVGFASHLGDEALAAMIHLSGDDLSEYGFDQPGNPSPTYQSRFLYGWGFWGTSSEEIEQIRQRAILKWRARQSRESDPASSISDKSSAGAAQ